MAAVLAALVAVVALAGVWPKPSDLEQMLHEAALSPRRAPSPSSTLVSMDGAKGARRRSLPPLRRLALSLYRAFVAVDQRAEDERLASHMDALRMRVRYSGHVE